jgi:hypothetical protein
MVRDEPGLLPFRMMYAPGEPSDECCMCGAVHRSGIFVRGRAEEFAGCALRQAVNGEDKQD